MATGLVLCVAACLTPVPLAHALPSGFTMTPTSGPTTGGTRVTITPPAAQGLKYVTASTGPRHTVAVGSDGNVYSWGDNSDGELGNGSQDVGVGIAGGFHNRAVKIAELNNAGIIEVGAGYWTSVALSSDGSVYTWGRGTNGELGQGSSTEHSLTPKKVVFPATAAKIVHISTGWYHTMCLDATGHLYAWGDDRAGQQGDGSSGDTTYYPRAVRIPQVSSVVSVATGWAHTLVLGSNGRLYSWGANHYGQIGSASSAMGIDTPVAVNTSLSFRAIGAGAYHSLAVATDDTVWTWGRNDGYQLGDGTATPKAEPVQISVPARLTSITGGWGYSTGMTASGEVWGWGTSQYGELADIGTSRYARKMTNIPVGVTFVRLIAESAYQTIAMAQDGTTWAWGRNNNGQLGSGGTASYYSTPQNVGLPYTAITGVSFGGVAGTGLAPGVAAGTWVVTTPPHAKGTVPVAVSWTVGGTPQPQPTDLSFTYMMTYTVKFVQADGTTPSIVPTRQVNENDPVGAVSPLPSRTGYTLSWVDASDGSAWNLATTPVTRDVTLKETWTAHQHTVTYIYQRVDGTPVTSTAQAAYGSLLSPPSTGRDDLLGWSTSQSGTILWRLNADTMPDSDLTLYAVWKRALPKAGGQPMNQLAGLLLLCLAGGLAAAGLAWRLKQRK
ncbi:hypothetical protein KIM372_12290 [Bombiscardovia nodaiensis]|uniref:RCC1-like domain-containing protein n=1 Tax=Bombiscardovia nodaiensis TaxID=2932181 RepID=A0ABM8B8V2_9BIFI|nr:hypothetical protein KIM372_12290 [Bombiscardovia nodaiensis]